jgi:hypothetical protein
VIRKVEVSLFGSQDGQKEIGSSVVFFKRNYFGNTISLVLKKA